MSHLRWDKSEEISKRTIFVKVGRMCGGGEGREANFPERDQLVNIFRFMGPVASVSTTLLCCFRAQSSCRQHVNECVWLPMKLY